MRQIGTLPDRRDALRFADYLLAIGIDSHAEENGEGWAIWVRDESHLDQARDELQAYRRDPGHPRFQAAAAAAEAVRRDRVRQQKEFQKNYVEMRGRWGGAGARRRVVLALIAVSVVVFFLTGFGKPADPYLHWLTFCQVEIVEAGPAGGGGMVRFPADRFATIKQGQVWRLLTPMFIHFGLVHLLFNMYMLYHLGGQVEMRRGSGPLLGLVLVFSLAANLAEATASQMFGGSPLFGGMSGVVYGVFGYLWMKSVFDPASGMFLSRDTVVILVGWFLLGATGLLEQLFNMRIANWAHGGGLAAGMVLGYLPTLWRRR